MKEPGTEIYRFDLKDLHKEEISRIYAIQEALLPTTSKDTSEPKIPD